MDPSLRGHAVNIQTPISCFWLGPLASMSATMNQSRALMLLACKAADIMLTATRMMQMRDVKSHGEQAIFCSNHFHCGPKRTFRVHWQM